MIYLKYLILIVIGWVLSIITGAIIGAIFHSHKSKVGGFISGLIYPSLTVLIILKLLVDKNINNTYDIVPIVFIIFPIIFINIQALYNSGFQDGKGDSLLPITRISLKINKGLVFGTLIGCVLALVIFTKFVI